MIIQTKAFGRLLSAMNGAVIFYAIATIFVAQVFGVHLSIGQQISLVLMTTCVSIGSPGIPGGAIVMTTMLLSNMGLPLDIVGVLAGINRLIDMGDTSLNVTGDIVSTLCIAKTEQMMQDESTTNSVIFSSKAVCQGEHSLN